MKKIVFLFLLGYCAASAQECKFQINEVDPFYKIKKVKTEDQVIAVTVASAIEFSFFKADQVYLCFNYRSSGIKSMVVGKTNSLMLLYNDDEVLEVYPQQIEVGKFSLEKTKFYCKYPISKEKIEKINITGLKKVRLNTSDAYYEFDVTKQKWIDRLKVNIDCFLKEIN